jgi:hypothetical protein
MQPRVLLDGLAMPNRRKRRDPMMETYEFADRYMSLWNEPDPNDAASSSRSCGPRRAPRSSSHRRRCARSQRARGSA